MALFECFPIEGSDGWTADLLLLCCCTSTLLLKQLFYETPDRTWMSFLLDTSKQAAGAVVALVLFRNTAECYLNLAGTLIEATFGVFMEYVLLTLLTSAIRATLGPSTIFSTGDYQDENGNISQTAYLAQLGIWLLCVTVTRAAMTSLVPTSLVQQQGAETSVFGELEHIMMVFVVPCTTKSLQVWVVDDFLKHGGSPALLRVLKQRALAQAALIGDVITRYTSRRSTPTEAQELEVRFWAEYEFDEESGLPMPMNAAAAGISGSPPRLPFLARQPPTQPAVVSSSAAAAAAAEPTAPVPPGAAPAAAAAAAPEVAATAPVSSIAAGSAAAAAAAAPGANEQAPKAPSKIAEAQEGNEESLDVSSKDLEDEDLRRMASSSTAEDDGQSDISWVSEEDSLVFSPFNHTDDPGRPPLLPTAAAPAEEELPEGADAVQAVVPSYPDLMEALSFYLVWEEDVWLGITEDCIFGEE